MVSIEHGLCYCNVCICGWECGRYVTANIEEGCSVRGSKWQLLNEGSKGGLEIKQNGKVVEHTECYYRINTLFVHYGD